MSQLDQAFIRAYGRKSPAAGPSQQAPAVTPQSAQKTTRIDDPAEAILAAVDDLLRQARPLAGAKSGAPERSSHFVTSATAGTQQALSPLPAKGTKQRANEAFAAEPVILPHPGKTASEKVVEAAETVAEPVEEQVETEPLVEAAEKPMQPLSEILGMHAPAAIERAPFRAAWEVDEFHWPKVCDLLLESSEDVLDEITGRIQLAAESGRKLLVVRGTRRGAGTTAAAAFFARVMAGTGMHVAALDGDLDNPRLGASVGLSNYHGWEHALDDEAPLEESAVASIEDALTMLPLGQLPEPPRDHVDAERFAGKIAHLLADFDLVIVDAGAVDIATKSLAGPPALPIECAATLLVSDVRHGGREPAAARRLIAESGELLVATFENFAPAVEETAPQETPNRKMAA